MATKTNDPTLYQVLSAHFPTEQHRKKSGGGGRELTYIPAEAIISRLNEVWGTQWTWAIRSEAIDLKERVVVVTGVLTYVDDNGDTQTKSGIGADQDYTGKAEIDKLVKTANTEALKNAAKLIGVGLYLYDDEERQQVEREMAGTRSGRPAYSEVPSASSYTGAPAPAPATFSGKPNPCKMCDEPIVWLPTRSGKKAPVDAHSFHGETVYDKEVHSSHFDTCKARQTQEA